LSPPEIFAKAVRRQRSGRLVEAAALYRQSLAARPDLRPRGPDFLVIGAGRAGTGWIRKCLSRHPNLRVLAGEHNYFSRRTELNPAAYSALFKPENFKGAHTATSGYLQGDKSPSYQFMESERIALCAALYPKAKIIFTVRDPIDRAWSHLKVEGMPTEGEKYERVVRVGHYEHDVRRWLKHYPHIHIVDFDDICTTPDAVTDALYRFLGVDPIEYRNVLGYEPLPAPRRGEAPEDIRHTFEEFYKGERWDAPWLRSIVAEAAGARGPSGQPASLAPAAG
jgi:hypothetical protein